MIGRATSIRATNTSGTRAIHAARIAPPPPRRRHQREPSGSMATMPSPPPSPTRPAACAAWC
jgi:hypothetical protein